MDKNYGFLRLATTAFKVLAYIGAVLGVISSIAIFIGSAPETPAWMGIVTLIVGAIYFFIFFVASEVVNLLLEIKEKIK